jgi:hypothetical protein
MSDESNELDQQLQRWARHSAPSEDRLRRLRREILNRAIPVPAGPSLAAPAWWQRVAGRAALAVMALSVLLAVMFLPREKKNAAGPSPAAIASLPEAHLQKLLAEVERLFDDHLAWVAETNNDVSLGIEPSGSSGSDRPRVAVRVVVMQRSSPTDPWLAIWKGDVAARAEELVQVDSPGDGSQLKLWTYVLPDGAVSVDSELAMPGAPAMWKSTSVQQPQVPLQVLSNRQGDAEYQVWQTAAVLPESAL